MADKNVGQNENGLIRPDGSIERLFALRLKYLWLGFVFFFPFPISSLGYERHKRTDVYPFRCGDNNWYGVGFAFLFSYIFYSISDGCSIQRTIKFNGIMASIVRWAFLIQAG